MKKFLRDLFAWADEHWILGLIVMFAIFALVSKIGGGIHSILGDTIAPMICLWLGYLFFTFGLHDKRDGKVENKVIWQSFLAIAGFFIFFTLAKDFINWLAAMI